MYGTLRGALAGRKIAFDRDSFKATVDGRISGIGNTIRIKSIHVHYDLAVPPEAREATERALQLHPRSEEHTSELQSRLHLVCRLLLEKKKKKVITIDHSEKKTRRCRMTRD